MGATRDLASFVEGTTYDQLPARVVGVAKQGIRDSLGVMCAGSGEDCVEMILRTVYRPSDGARIIGRSERVSPLDAALINGTAAHALDYDDSNVSLRGHPSAPVLPALLALSETHRISGKDLILAYVIGLEVECKLGSAINMEHYELGWHATSTLGTLGAAAAASKALGLSADGIARALGIAASLSAGIRQNFGTMTKPLHAGMAARNGLTSALLAAEGFTADERILEARYGFCNVFCGPGKYDLGKAVKRLGSPWELESPGLIFKMYPSCLLTHRPIQAALSISRSHDFSPEDIKKVHAEVIYRVPQVLIHHNPATGLQGKFSLEYTVAAALVRRKVGLDDFADEQVRDPVVRDVLSKVTYSIHPDLSTRDKVLDEFAIVNVTLRDGRVLTSKADKLHGSPDDPATESELVSKFRDCARRLDGDRIDNALRLIGGLEALQDCGQLLTVLTPGGI